MGNGAGGYVEAGGTAYYVMASGDDLPKDTEGNTYQEVTDSGSHSGEQRYVETGTAWVADRTYDLDHYNYSGKNTGGTEILSRTGGTPQFLVTGGTGTSITIHDAAGNLVTYNTENTEEVLNTRLSGGSYSAKVELAYETGVGDRTTTLTVTPNGPAYRSFAMQAWNRGGATDTNLTVKVNPPEKLLHIQAGALGGQSIDLEWPALTNSIVGISGARVTSFATSQATIRMADDAIDFISGVRSRFGALQNRLEHAYDVNCNTEENTQTAESRIRDTNMAKEMVSYSKNEILAQAGQAMLVQANQQPSGILTLLQ